MPTFITEMDRVGRSGDKLCALCDKMIQRKLKDNFCAEQLHMLSYMEQCVSEKEEARTIAVCGRDENS